MDDLERELKVGFLDEAQQLLVDAEQCFLEVESRPDDDEIINKLFRLAHNLKGSAKAVGFMQMGAFTHSLESLLLKIKNRERKIDSFIVSLLLECKDTIQLMIDALKEDLGAEVECASLQQRLEDETAGVRPEASEAPLKTLPAIEVTPEEIALLAEPPPEVPDASVFANLEESMKTESDAWSESAQSPAMREVLPKSAPTLQSTQNASVSASADESIRVSLGRLDKLIDYVGEMVILQSVLAEQAHSGNVQLLRKTVHQLGKVTKEIQDISMSLRMVPLKPTFQKMQRIVRDTSHALGKKVHLSVVGEETELEKTVLELIGDPLVHLVRNAVDHGIDSGEERRAAGKPEMGHIELKAYHQVDNIVIEVRDDGKGIDADRLRAKALERGILTAGQSIADQAAINLIFHPGFSTKQEVTDISGRGVGLDVVKTNIERLQGIVNVSTELGKGSVFRIQLPLTLAIIDATTVYFGEQRFVIPMSQIYESVQVTEEQIHKSVNAGEIFYLRGEDLPVFRLSRMLNLKDDEKSENKLLLISKADTGSFAVLVNDISPMQQIVIKKLGRELAGLRGITGSAILGDGRPALILDLVSLIRHITNAKSSTVKSPNDRSQTARLPA